jgi:hypothetical protein
LAGGAVICGQPLSAAQAYAPPASAESLAAFAGICPEAKALVESWGRRAPELLAKSYAGLELTIAALGEDDQAAAHAWLGALTPKLRTAVVRAMAER